MLKRKGFPKPRGVVVEGIPKNNRIGFALVANAKVYWLVIVIPKTNN